MVEERLTRFVRARLATDNEVLKVDRENSARPGHDPMRERVAVANVDLIDMQVNVSRKQVQLAKVSALKRCHRRRTNPPRPD